MSKMLKKDYLAEEARILEKLKEFGAKELSSRFDGERSFSLKTPAGEMIIRIYEWKPNSYNYFCIFQRLEDAGRAKKYVDCNPHSGKWNFYSFDDWNLSMNNFLQQTQGNENGKSH